MRKSKDELELKIIPYNFSAISNLLVKLHVKENIEMVCYSVMRMQKHLKSVIWYFSIVFLLKYELWGNNFIQTAIKDQLPG